MVEASEVPVTILRVKRTRVSQCRIQQWRKWIRVISVLCDEFMLLAVLAAANRHVGCI